MDLLQATRRNAVAKRQPMIHALTRQLFAARDAVLKENPSKGGRSIWDDIFRRSKVSTKL